MVTLSNATKRPSMSLLLALVGILTLAQPGLAAQGPTPDVESSAEALSQTNASTGNALRVLGLAFGAGIAIAGAGIATSRVQAAVGAGGTGAITEKPELFGNVLILFAIPETIVVFGFVIAIMLVLAI